MMRKSQNSSLRAFVRISPLLVLFLLICSNDILYYILGFEKRDPPEIWVFAGCVFVAYIAYFLFKKDLIGVLFTLLVVVSPVAIYARYQPSLIGTQYVALYLKTYIFHFTYPGCRADAAEVNGNGRLAVCQVDRFDAPSPYGLVKEMIVYDTTDQILLPPEKRAQSWNDVALKIELRQNFNVGTGAAFVPKPSDLFAHPLTLGFHFYEVTE